jgi:Fe-S-cluster containining protein
MADTFEVTEENYQLTLAQGRYTLEPGWYIMQDDGPAGPYTAEEVERLTRPTPEGYKCPGYCCEAFSVGPHEDFVRQMQRVIRDNPGDNPEDLLERTEAQQLMELFVPLPGAHVRNPTLKWAGDANPPAGAVGGEFHTCTAFNKETKSCGVYATRPRLCQKFPNWEPCQFEGCEHGPRLQNAARRPDGERLLSIADLTQTLIETGDMLVETHALENG